MNDFKLAIIGHGFVGKAIDSAFSHFSATKYIIDPKEQTTIRTMLDGGFVPNIIFVSVPTPMKADGSIDSRIIESVFQELRDTKEEHNCCLAVIKSTITPEIIRKLRTIYPKLIFNPEFLTEANADEEFRNPQFHVFGTDNIQDSVYLEWVYNNYSNCKKCQIFTVSPETASLVKYTINSFLASKVLFFNQIKELFDKTPQKDSWYEFTTILRNDPRIGSSHMDVPGPDGRFGFAGACFPKDCNAIVDYANSRGVDLSQLKETIRANQEIRKLYSEPTQREKEQNIHFDIDLPRK